MITAIWDNGGKGGRNAERYTVIKNGFVHFVRPDGTWDIENVIRDTKIPSKVSGIMAHEVDRVWMDKNQISISDFSTLPVIIQQSCEQMVYP